MEIDDRVFGFLDGGIFSLRPNDASLVIRFNFVLGFIGADIGVKARPVEGQDRHFFAVNWGGWAGAGEINAKEDNRDKEQTFSAHWCKFELKVIN